MKSLPFLLALALTAPPLTGCAPVLRGGGGGGGGGDDDDAANDDDTSNEDLPEEGWWMSSSVEVLEDSCGIGGGAGSLGFDLRLDGEWGDFLVDFGVGADLSCTTFGDSFECDPSDFVMDETDDTLIEGAISFGGTLSGSSQLSGTVSYVVVCSGPGCEDVGLPSGAECFMIFEGVFVPDGDIDVEPPQPG